MMINLQQSDGIPTSRRQSEEKQIRSGLRIYNSHGLSLVPPSMDPAGGSRQEEAAAAKTEAAAAKQSAAAAQSTPPGI